jgi:hypothetical protein
MRRWRTTKYENRPASFHDVNLLFSVDVEAFSQQRTYEDVGTRKNLQECNCLTELYSAISKLAGAYADPPWQTSVPPHLWHPHAAHHSREIEISRKEAPFQLLAGNIANNELSKGNGKDPTTDNANNLDPLLLMFKIFGAIWETRDSKVLRLRCALGSPVARLGLSNN